MLEVQVEEGKIDMALRVLKKKLSKAGVFRKLKEKRFYEPPSVKKQRKRKEALRKLQKKTRRKYREF